MKIITLTTFAGVVLSGTPAMAAAQAARGTHAFTGVNVVPMDRERVVENQTVVVRDGRIVELGAAGTVTVPAGATRIDGRGKFLMPGLAEMHGHLPGERSREAEDILFLYVANGVTTVRGMQGAPEQLAMRDAIAGGELWGPLLYVSSPAISGNRVSSAMDAARLVRDYKAAGYDHLKVHEGLSKEVYDAIAATANNVDISFAGHVTDAVSAFYAMEAGQASIDHLDNMYDAVDGDASRIPELVRTAVATNTGVVPTEVLWETAFLTPGDPQELRVERPEIRYMSPDVVDRWSGALERRRAQGGSIDEGRRQVAFRRSLIDALYDGGALLLLGTDSPQIFSVPGFSIRREMQAMVESGLMPYEVLVAGTRNVARYFEIEDEAGTVAVGKRADLILLDANPLADVRNVGAIAGVMVNGRWLAKDEIDRRLAQIAAQYR